MLTFFEQLLEIRELSRKREKFALLRRYDSPTLRDILFYAFSPTVNFGVGHIQFDSEATQATTDSLYEFLSLCQRLASKELTGVEAEEAVRSHLGSYPAWIRQMVSDFFAGCLYLALDVVAINEALPGTIPMFGLQVSRTFKQEYMTYPAFVSARLSGMRCLLFVTNGGVSLLSSNGNHIHCLPHLAKVFKDAPLGVYDGVLLHKDGDMQTTVTICRRQDFTPEALDIQFNVYDYIPLREWNKPVTLAKDRFKALDYIYSKHLETSKSPTWFIVQHTVVNNSLELARFRDIMLASGMAGTLVQFNKPYIKTLTTSFLHL